VFRRLRLSYANVVASLALFIALGGSAAAAATLARDSVGSPQIRKDAVRSPEIAADAVRSSELADQGIKIGDIADGARTALLGDLLVAELDDGPAVPVCDDLRACTDILTLDLSSGDASRAVEQAPPASARNWLVQAKADLLVQRDTTSTINTCGLVDTSVSGPAAVLDQVDAGRSDESSDAIALSAVVKKRAGNPTIALRCTARQDGDVDRVSTDEVKITALEVGAITGP